MEVRYCSNCGSRLEPDAGFCWNCGRPVRRPDQTPTPEVFNGSVVVLAAFATPLFLIS